MPEREVVVVALQGSIESFHVADVLRLLDASAKVGRLVVTGDRGTASVWVEGGSIVAGVPSFGGPPDLEIGETVLDLLRFASGSFVFEAEVRCDVPGAPMAIGPAVDAAEAALREIESLTDLIPSADAVVSMTPSLPGDTVTLDRSSWAALAQLSAGVTVSELGRRLGLDDVALFRQVALLVELGVAQVGEAQPFFSRQSDHMAMPSGRESHADDGVWDGAVWGISMDAAQDDAFADETSSAELPADEASLAPAAAIEPILVAPRVEADVPEGLEELFGDFDPFAPEDSFAAGAAAVEGDGLVGEVDEQGTDDESPADAEELARQMAMLSPRAAQAVAAAAARGEDGPDPDAESDPDEARQHLVRFLDSVN